MCKTQVFRPLLCLHLLRLHHLEITWQGLVLRNHCNELESESFFKKEAHSVAQHSPLFPVLRPYSLLLDPKANRRSEVPSPTSAAKREGFRCGEAGEGQSGLFPSSLLFFYILAFHIHIPDDLLLPWKFPFHLILLLFFDTFSLQYIPR